MIGKAIKRRADRSIVRRHGGDKELLRVRRKFGANEDTFFGAPRAVGQEFVIYEVVHDLIIWNGFTAVRASDIVDDAPLAKADFYLKALAAKPKRTYGALPPGLTGLPKIFRFLAESNISASFHFETFRAIDENFSLGRLIDWTDDQLSIMAFDADGRRYDELETLNIRALTRIDFLGGYESAFDLVAEGSSQSRH